MKKVIAFILVLLIFVSPVTTFVKADVVIGDNDETIINENATILGRKLALMESLSDLALSGVTDFTISNTNDVDSYLDYLWSEVNDAIDYLDSGEWANDLSNDIASKYFTNLVQYKDYINNRGDYLAHLLPSGDPSTNLLSTFFANNIFGKHSTLHNNLSLDMFRSLSRLNNNDNNANPPQDYSWVSNINNLILKDSNNLYHDFYSSNFSNQEYGYAALSPYPLRSMTYVANDGYLTTNHTMSSGTTASVQFSTYNPISVYLTVNDNQTCSMVCSASNFTKFTEGVASNARRYSCTWYGGNNTIGVYVTSTQIYYPLNQNFNSLDLALNYVYGKFSNINLYVNNEPWALVSVNNNPILDIDGLLKIYGNDNPQQYQLQPNTKIDYDQLYQVIYNAIRDNLPISQGDINYYDSHDTIYSPTIINNYGEEEGDESDLIDTILDYAVIPKFDTSIAQPMRAALTNGVVIMQNSITNVIPNEILLILGACFFLLLFAVVINRMIK